MKALVLCAGYGTRLGAASRSIPKPMLLIEGQPLLAYTMRYLAIQGFRQVAINLHHQPQTIRDYFGDGSRFGVAIHYSYEKELLGTAGAIKHLEPYFADAEDFLVIYGDLLLDQDLTRLVRFHRQKRASATLLLHQRPGSNSLVQMDDDQRITAFIERPTSQQRKAWPHPWVNSGAQILNRCMLARIPGDRPCDLPRDVYMPHLDRERIFGVPLTAYRCAIDSPQRYEEAKLAVREGRYRPFGTKSWVG